MLRHHERPGEDRGVGRVGLLHPPGDLGRTHHLDVADELVPGAPRRFEVGIDQELDREFDVLGRERRAVMPFDAVAQLDLPIEPVGRDTAIRDRRDLGGKLRRKITLGTDAPERAEEVPVDALIDLDMRHQRVEHRRLLRDADDHLARRLRRRRGPAGARPDDRGGAGRQRKVEERAARQPARRGGAAGIEGMLVALGHDFLLRLAAPALCRCRRPIVGNALACLAPLLLAPRVRDRHRAVAASRR